MIISSRFDEDDSPTIGSGNFTLQVDSDQLELITALVCNVRLGGKSAYSTAAYNLINTIENDFGSDFLDDCSTAVNVNVTIEDDSGVVLNTKTGQYEMILEV